MKRHPNSPKPAPVSDADRTLAFIQTPDQWPLGCCCPLTRRTPGKPPELAYMLAYDAAPIIYRGNAFNPKETDPSEKFTSYAAIANAGWLVN